MEKDKVKETLEKQLQLLSERSKQIIEQGNAADNELKTLTNQMIQLALILDPVLQSQSASAAYFPFVGHLSMSDLEELAQARRERARRELAEAKQFYKNLESR